jgi:hypothetical protein
MKIHEQTSQFKNWIFSKEKLVEIRQSAHQEAIDRITTLIKEEKVVKKGRFTI